MQASKPDDAAVNVDAENVSTSSVGVESDSNAQTPLPGYSNCYLELTEHLHLLNEAQTAAIWQLLSQRLNTEHLNWHNWSREKLERLVAQAQQAIAQM